MTGSSGLPQSFLDDLLARVDLVEIIGDRVELKRAGQEFTGRCPFHDEKTPSFSVSSHKQLYYCFGCGAGGNAITFLMEQDRLNFPEAVERLAKRANITIPEQFLKGPAKNNKEDGALTALLQQVAQFYQWQLRHHDNAPAIIQYLKNRGISGEIAKTFGMGYAPPGWDGVLKQFPADTGNLLKLGLLIKNDKGRIYDRFRDRVMFPIRNRFGHIIGFGGRVQGDGQPKYLNSPESPLFHKGKELYGLYETLQANRKVDRVIIVEGYMDVVALFQQGLPFACATMGTATTPDHLRLLNRYTSHIIFCFDGDRAGKQAAWRALETAMGTLQEGMKLSFLFLPEGEDPDSLIRAEGKAAFEKRLDEQAVGLSDYFFQGLRERVPGKDMGSHIQMVKAAMPLIASVPEGLWKTLLLDELSHHVGMTVQQLREWQSRSGQTKTPQPEVPTPIQRRPVSSAFLQKPSAVRTAIIHLVQNPELAKQFASVVSELQCLDKPGVGLLCELLILCEQNPAIQTSAQLLNHFEGSDVFAVLTTCAQKPSLLAPEAVASEFTGAIEQLYRFATTQQIETLMKKASTGHITQEERQHLQQLLAEK